MLLNSIRLRFDATHRMGREGVSVGVFFDLIATKYRFIIRLNDINRSLLRYQGL